MFLQVAEAYSIYTPKRRSKRLGENKKIDELLEIYRNDIFAVKEEIDDDYERGLNAEEEFEWGVRGALRAPPADTANPAISQHDDISQYFVRTQQELKKESDEIRSDLQDFGREMGDELRDFHASLSGDLCNMKEQNTALMTTLEELRDDAKRKTAILEELRDDVKRMSDVLEAFMEVKTAKGVTKESAGGIEDNQQVLLVGSCVDARTCEIGWCVHSSFSRRCECRGKSNNLHARASVLYILFLL
jgi:uncharacterized protein YoxC